MTEVDIDRVKEQAMRMVSELENDSDPDESRYLRKFKYLQKTSNTLFKFIFNNVKTERFDMTSFTKNLDMMLNSLRKVQDTTMSRHTASVAIGQELANQFIPQLKK
ncbi:MAG: hypothetical protein EBU90_02210 [Proteobacteria bacterium]|nr:hypothetical protein [Pseudomonadota bacterium]NBP13298.1 hypothetical protein [bacterium]